MVAQPRDAPDWVIEAGPRAQGAARAGRASMAQRAAQKQEQVALPPSPPAPKLPSAQCRPRKPRPEDQTRPGDVMSPCSGPQDLRCPGQLPVSTPAVRPGASTILHTTTDRGIGQQSQGVAGTTAAERWGSLSLTVRADISREPSGDRQAQALLRRADRVLRICSLHGLSHAECRLLADGSQTWRRRRGLPSGAHT